MVEKCCLQTLGSANISPTHSLIENKGIILSSFLCLVVTIFAIKNSNPLSSLTALVQAISTGARLLYFSDRMISLLLFLLFDFDHSRFDWLCGL